MSSSSHMRVYVKSTPFGSRCARASLPFTLITITALSGLFLSCESPYEAQVLYSTEEVLKVVFGETLPLYSTCEVKETEESSMPPQPGLSQADAYNDPCSIDALASCERGDEAACERPAPQCYQDISSNGFCTQVCEADEDCPGGGRCVSTHNRPSSAMRRLGVEEVYNVFGSGTKMCVTDERAAQSREQITQMLTELGLDLDELKAEHEECDPDAMIDGCELYHDLGCFSRELPESQCYPAEPSSPVKCRDREGSSLGGVCLKRCIDGCLDDEECDGDYCVKAQ